MPKSKEDKYQCLICKQYFINPATLNQHIKYKHPESLKQTKIDSPQANDEKLQSLIETKTGNPEENPISEETLKLEKKKLDEEKIKFEKEKEDFENEEKKRRKIMGEEEVLKKVDQLAQIVGKLAEKDTEQERLRLRQEEATKRKREIEEQLKPIKEAQVALGKEQKLIGNMICDKNGVCRLATKEEIASIKQGIDDIKVTIKPKSPEKKPEEKKGEEKPEVVVPSGYIKEDEHKKMWELLAACKEPNCFDYIRKEMAKDEKTRKLVIDTMKSEDFERACTSPECKAEREKLLKEQGIEIRKKKGERKGGFLAGGGEEWKRL